MTIVLDRCTLRAFRADDRENLARQANNPRVALHLRDRFPQPYTLADADVWIAHVAGQSPTTSFAIAVDDQLIGGIGLHPECDIYRVSAEVGYWIGEEYWGRGIATSALAGLTEYAFRTFAHLHRLFAYVDEDHIPSIRVLERALFRQEGRLIGAAIKHGQLKTVLLYAITRPEIGCS